MPSSSSWPVSPYFPEMFAFLFRNADHWQVMPFSCFSWCWSSSRELFVRAQLVPGFSDRVAPGILSTPCFFRECALTTRFAVSMREPAAILDDHVSELHLDKLHFTVQPAGFSRSPRYAAAHSFQLELLTHRIRRFFFFGLRSYGLCGRLTEEK